MAKRYYVPQLSPFAGDFRHESMFFRFEEEVRRSRFITTLGHAPDSTTARAFIEAVRAEFADATHNCWAFAAGPPGDTAQVGYSDDGEPHGTAGRPMLTVLLHADMGELVAVTTRYFGGIKLGTGGLVRAYQSGVRQALELLPRVEKVPRSEVSVLLDYAHTSRLRRLLPAYQTELLSEAFDTDALWRLSVPDELRPALLLALQNATDGAVVFLEDEPPNPENNPTGLF